MPFLKPVDPCQDSVAQALLPVPLSRDALREPQDILHLDGPAPEARPQVSPARPEARLAR
jgi:hypothetical protein